MKYRHRVLGFLFVLSIITFLDRVSVSVMGARMQSDLGITPKQWGWVLGAFALAYGIFEIPAGAQGDRKGTRRVLTRIVVWWSVFAGFTGLARNFWQVLTTRFLFGAGAAGAYPNCSASIARWFPKDERARAQGIVWMGSRFGAAAAPLIMIPIQATLGWRVGFLFLGIVGAAWAAVWFAWFRDSPREKIGVGESELSEIGEGAAPAKSESLPWGRAFSRPNLWWIIAMYFCYCWSSHFYLTWLNIFLQNGRGFAARDLLRYSWLPFVFGAGANVLGGLTSDALVRRIGLKWGRRLVGITGLGLSAIFTAATALTHSKVLSIVFLALGYAGSDFMLPVAWAVCLDVGGRHSGAVSGAMNMAGHIGGAALASVAFGYLVAGFGSYDAPLIPMAAMTAVSALLWLKIDPTQPLVE